MEGGGSGIKGGEIDEGGREWWTEGEVETEGEGRDGVMEGGRGDGGGRE